MYSIFYDISMIISLFVLQFRGRYAVRKFGRVVCIEHLFKKRKKCEILYRPLIDTTCWRHIGYDVCERTNDRCSVQPSTSHFSVCKLSTTATVDDVTSKPEIIGARSLVGSMSPTCTWCLTHDSCNWSSPFCPVTRNVKCSSDGACQLPVASTWHCQLRTASTVHFYTTVRRQNERTNQRSMFCEAYMQFRDSVNRPSVNTLFLDAFDWMK